MTWQQFTLLSRLSLGMCVMFIAAWVAAIHFHGERFHPFGDRSFFVEFINHGDIAVGGWPGRSQFPPFLLALLTGLPPLAHGLAGSIAAGRAARQVRRDLDLARRGLCRNCGYDLRASPVRCPECGRPTPQVPTPT